MRGLFVIIGLLHAGFSLAQIRSESSSARAEAPFYSSLEIRHHLNTYYEGKQIDEHGDYLERQEPSLHLRIQIGKVLYAGLVDAYATLGIFKRTQTQQILQRRPEVSVDLYPIRMSHFTLMQYNMIQLPFEAREQDPTADVDGTDAGSIFTVGLAPALHTVIGSTLGRFNVRAVLDGWTRLYSRKRFTRDYDDPDGSPRDDRLALDDDNNGEDGGAEASDTQEIEDFAAHYETQSTIAFGYSPTAFPILTTEIAGNYNSKFEPRYTRTATGTDYEYKADRYSYYKFRLKLAINDRVSVMNDFYHFHGGLFADKRRGDERRFRNIARLSCKL